MVVTFKVLYGWVPKHQEVCLSCPGLANLCFADSEERKVEGSHHRGGEEVGIQQCGSSVALLALSNILLSKRRNVPNSQAFKEAVNTFLFSWSSRWWSRLSCLKLVTQFCFHCIINSLVYTCVYVYVHTFTHTQTYCVCVSLCVNVYLCANCFFMDCAFVWFFVFRKDSWKENLTVPSLPAGQNT